MKKLVLCSGSPRRSKILRQLGLGFSVARPAGPEEAPVRVPWRLARALARGKVLEIARSGRSGVLLGFDTLVCLGPRVFGKPSGLPQAREFLQKLSGRWHTVITGVCVLDTAQNRLLTGHAATRVKFFRLSRARIDRYLSLIDPLDKAGAYTIEGHGALIVERIAGCHDNVVGLPVAELSRLLLRLGVDLLELCR